MFRVIVLFIETYKVVLEDRVVRRQQLRAGRYRREIAPYAVDNKTISITR